MSKYRGLAYTFRSDIKTNEELSTMNIESSVSYQHLQPRMVYVTDQGFAVKPASHILRMLRAVTAPPMIRVGSLSVVAATLPCFGKRAAGSNVRLKRTKTRKDAAGVLSLTLRV